MKSKKLQSVINILFITLSFAGFGQILSSLKNARKSKENDKISQLIVKKVNKREKTKIGCENDMSLSSTLFFNKKRARSRSNSLQIKQKKDFLLQLNLFPKLHFKVSIDIVLISRA